MADIVCPDCGSIDHIAEGEVRFPYQCPGCDAVIAGPPAKDEETPAPETGKPVHMQLLRTVQWNPQDTRKSPSRAGAWLFVGMFAVPVAIIVIAWSMLFQPQPESYSATLAQDPDVSAPAIPGASVAGTPSAAPSDSKPSASTQAANAARGLARVAAGEDVMESSMPTAPDEPLSRSEAADSQSRPSPQSIPRGIRTALPLYAGVPILARPSWEGQQIGVLSESDRLLIVEHSSHNDWLHVVRLLSGTEGWVRQNQVMINDPVQMTSAGH